MSCLFDYYFLNFRVLAVHQSHDIDACVEVGGAESSVATDRLAAEDATSEVNHLQSGCTHVADDPFAAIEEGERLCAGHVFLNTSDIEHQAWARAAGRCRCQSYYQ